ncbi:MAG: hypothetical protein ACREAY_02215 [Nitrososphaera sp.]
MSSTLSDMPRPKVGGRRKVPVTCHTCNITLSTHQVYARHVKRVHNF